MAETAKERLSAALEGKPRNFKQKGRELLISLDPADLAELCGQVKQPDQKVRDLAKGAAACLEKRALKPDKEFGPVHIRSNDGYHLLDALGV